jgi:hypothetical protein
MASIRIPTDVPESPNLCIVAGFPRAGSTFLYHNLGLHPQLFSPFRKETNFFLSNYERGLKWYLSLFKERSIHHKYCLDISPSYFVDTSTIQRIQDYEGETKVIIVVRNLDELVISWYEQQLTHFKNFIPFETFISDWKAQRGDKEIQIKMSDAPFKKALIAFQEAFGSNLLLIKFEELTTNSLSSLHAIERFLDIEEHYNKENFANLAINSRNRKNFRLLTWILSRELTISFINILFPRTLVLRLRSALDKRSSRVPPTSQSIDSRSILIRNIIEEDIEYVNRLFSINSIMLGDGQPFDNLTNSKS